MLPLWLSLSSAKAPASGDRTTISSIRGCDDDDDDDDDDADDERLG